MRRIWSYKRWQNSSACLGGSILRRGIYDLGSAQAGIFLPGAFSVLLDVPADTANIITLIAIYRSYTVYFSFHFCADVQRFKTFAFFSKAKKNIIVIFVFNEREIYNIMLITIRKKVVIVTKFKYPIQHRFVNA